MKTILEQGDLRNDKDLQRVFEVRRPWAVMHFAAYAYVGESTVEPAKYYDNNVGGTAKLLQACAAFECNNVVFSVLKRLRDLWCARALASEGG